MDIYTVQDVIDEDNGSLPFLFSSYENALLAARYHASMLQYSSSVDFAIDIKVEEFGLSPGDDGNLATISIGNRMWTISRIKVDRQPQEMKK